MTLNHFIIVREKDKLTENDLENEAKYDSNAKQRQINFHLTFFNAISSIYKLTISLRFTICCPWTLENYAWKSLLRLRMDTCRSVARKRSNKRTKGTKGDRLNAKHIKSLLILWLDFIRSVSFSLPLICHNRPRPMKTDKTRTFIPFIHTWRSLRQCSCWHACHKMKMAEHVSINIYNVDLVDTFSQKYYAFYIQSTETQQKGDKESRLLQKQEKATSLWKKRLKVVVVLLRQSACLPNTYNANVYESMQSRYHILSCDQLLSISSADTLLPNHVKNNIRLNSHCTASHMGSATAHNQDSWQGKSHTWGSLRRFCWHACHQPAMDGKVCTSLCNSGLRIQRENRSAEMQPIDWSLWSNHQWHHNVLNMNYCDLKSLYHSQRKG